jgi:medium-chain acyl-[acyl-carrier-protein] hydrolase
MAGLPDAELIAHLRAIGGTPAEVLDHAELMALMLPILRADFAAYESYIYTPGAPLDCPLTAYGGVDDATADHAALRGWQAHTCAEFRLTQWPGGHFYLAAQTAAVARALGRALPG